MDPIYLLNQLSTNPDRIRPLVADVSPEQARWKPDPDSWSILEVVNHLYDEEREDFRVRLNLILHDPDKEWPPIDPQGWVMSRKYNERDLGESLHGFLEERRASLSWLESLENPAWEAACQAPWGRISAGDMFAAWAAHDLLHLRQLVELQRAYLVHRSSPYNVEYAGPW